MGPALTTDPKSPGDFHGGLGQLWQCLRELELATQTVEQEFNDSTLNMNDYLRVSERLKRMADEFYNRFP